MKSKFPTVWARIEVLQGQSFTQLPGEDFTYEVRSGCVAPDRTNRLIPRGQFKRAWEMVPLQGAAAVQFLQSPTYIYAILMDPRVSAGEW